MAYDEELAERIRARLAHRGDVAEKRMFGGLAFLLGGNMAVAASGQGGLLVRCDPAESADHIAAGAQPMIMRGKPMNGWLRVEGDAVTSDDDLGRWIGIGEACASSIPPK